MKRYPKGNHEMIEFERDIEMFNAKELEAQLLKIIEESPGKSLVLNFKNVQYLDSSGLGMLIKGYTRAKGNNVAFALVEVGESVANLLKTAKLFSLFTIHADESTL